MGKFKANPLPTSPEAAQASDDQSVVRFIAGADRRTAESLPWDDLDSKAKPTVGINLRLNEYELAIIRHISQLEERSIQKTIKRHLIPALVQQIHRAIGDK